MKYGNLYLDLNKNNNSLDNKSSEKIFNSNIKLEINNISSIENVSSESISLKSENLKELIEIKNKMNFLILNHQKINLHSLLNNKELTNLKILDLRENDITDISPLSEISLENLQYIDLENNKLNNKCLEILLKLKLPNITYLSLYNNKITSINTEFWAINNKINDIKEINYLINKEKIKAIYLNENNISKIDNDFLNILESFPNLNMINLEKNPINFIAYKNIKEKIESKGVKIVY